MNIDEKHWNRIDELERRDEYDAASRAYVAEILAQRRTSDIRRTKEFGLMLAIIISIATILVALKCFGAM